MFTHFIITRYNLSLNFRKSKTGLKLLDEAWYRNREYIFSKYCVNSVLNQSTDHFSWLILVDIDTPLKEIQILSNIVSVSQKIKLVHIKNGELISTELSELCKAMASDDNSSHVILTRLDNDDMLHKACLQNIQDQFTRQEFQIINLKKGLTFDMIRKSLRVQKLEQGPFISTIEKIVDGNFSFFSTGSHMSIDHTYSVSLDHESLWCQVIHRYNVNNYNKGELLRRNDKALDFGFEIKDLSSLRYCILLLHNKLLETPFFKIKNLVIKVYDRIRNA